MEAALMWRPPTCQSCSPLCALHLFILGIFTSEGSPYTAVVFASELFSLASSLEHWSVIISVVTISSSSSYAHWMHHVGQVLFSYIYVSQNPFIFFERSFQKNYAPWPLERRLKCLLKINAWAHLCFFSFSLIHFGYNLEVHLHILFSRKSKACVSIYWNRRTTCSFLCTAQVFHQFLCFSVSTWTLWRMYVANSLVQSNKKNQVLLLCLANTPSVHKYKMFWMF